MIRLTIQTPNAASRTIESESGVISLGRGKTNDIVIPFDGVSSHHAQILFENNRYVLRDLKSTNGTLVVHGDKTNKLDKKNSNIPLKNGDCVHLADRCIAILVDIVDLSSQLALDVLERTVIAEHSVGPEDLTSTLGRESVYMIDLVDMAGSLSELESSAEIIQFCCSASLRLFPGVDRIAFHVPHDRAYHVVSSIYRNQPTDHTKIESTFIHHIFDRCLSEKKAFLFCVNENKVKPVAHGTLSDGNRSQPTIS